MSKKKFVPAGPKTVRKCGPQKVNSPRGGPKELSTDISALCPLQDPREAYLRPC